MKNTEYVEQMVFETAALELGLELKTVKEVFQAQVEFTSRKIAEGTLETVMWPDLGKFTPKMDVRYKQMVNLATREIKKATKNP